MKKVAIWLVIGFINVGYCSSQIVINEIFATNNNSFLDRSTFNFACYVELYNKGNQSVGIGGFYLSNNESVPGKFRLPWSITIPPQGYYIVFTDELGKLNHANFRLDADGGKLFFYNRDYKLLDSVTYGKQFPDLPYGQKPDGSGNWTRLSLPSPATSNNEIQSGDQVCPKPTIIPKAGFYDGSVKVSIQPNLSNAKTHYTTDGSEPTLSSPVYEGPFTVSATTIVKARNFHATYLAGSTTCNSFLINQRKSQLPMISISTNPEYLFDDSIGIYVVGKNGIKSSCPGVANWNQDWKRPAFVEFFNPDGSLIFTQGIDLKIAGGCTRSLPLKSLGLMPSSRYGSGNFNYEFFDSKPQKKGFGSLLVRNSGNDFNMTMFRDALLHELCINKLDVDYQAFQPAAVFLNGEYLSLMNIREKVDKNYFRVNHHLPLDSIILLERNKLSIHGSAASFSAFFDSLSIVDMGSPDGYKFLDRNIDINEFLNYLAVQIYTINKDWPGNNYKFWKSTKPGSKWRWILTDLDFGFGLRHSPLDSTLYYVTEANGPFWPNPPWSTLLIRKVFENPVTRNMFIQKMQVVINTVFSEERVNAKIDSIKNIIASEMPYHWQKFGGNEQEWNKHIDLMRNFNKVRRVYMSRHLKQFFGLDEDRTEFVIKNTDKEKATYFVNKVQVNDTLPSEYAADTPLEIVAKPLPGYEFVEWKIKNYKIQKTSVFPRFSSWKFYDQNPANLTAGWQNPSFDDSAWPEGYGEFGYGDNDENTILNFGGNTSNKYLTAAFRKKIHLSELKKDMVFKGEILFDDGAIVYVNGKEVLRIGMPQGIISSNTVASFDKEDDNYYHEFIIPSEFLKIGENLIAVEVHQFNIKSPDLSFEFALFYEQKESLETFTSSSATIEGSYNKCMELTASFKAAQPIQGLYFNEVSASNKTIPDNRGDYDDWIEIYNAGPENVDLSRVNIEFRGKRNIIWNLGSKEEVLLKPGSFAVFWADDEVVQGPSHLPFKLPGEGEVIRLVQPLGNSKIVLDSIKITSKDPGLTLGRYPDGYSNWFYMASITPGVRNVYQSNSTSEVSLFGDLVVYPNPASDFVNIQLGNDRIKEYQVDLVGNDGRILKSMKLSNAIEKIDISGYSDGLYLLKVSNGNTILMKKIILMRQNSN